MNRDSAERWWCNDPVKAVICQSPFLHLERADWVHLFLNSMFSDSTLIAYSQPWWKYWHHGNWHTLQIELFYVLENCYHWPAHPFMKRKAAEPPSKQESIEWVLPCCLFPSQKGQRHSTNLQRSDKTLLSMLSDKSVGLLFWIWWKRRPRDSELSWQIMHTTMLNHRRQMSFERQIHLDATKWILPQ